MNTAKYQDMEKIELNFDASIIIAQTEIINSLCKVRDLIKQAFDTCMDSISAPTLPRVSTAIKVSCTKTSKLLSNDNRKQKMNQRKAVRQIQEMNEDEANAFAISLASEKLLVALCDVVMNKCLRSFSQLRTTHMLKQRTKAIVHNVADDTCSQFSAKTHELFAV